MMTAVAIGAFGLLFLGFPLWMVFMSVSVFALYFFTNVPMDIVANKLFNSLNQFVLLSVPGFIFTGEVMTRGGMSKRLVTWVASLLGKIPGGLSLTTVGASELFGAISGSSPATVAALGPTLYPGLLAAGYSEAFSLGLITSCGAIAIIIPPSLSMIMYAVVTNASVGQLFLAGFLPGIMIGIFIAAYCIWYAVRHRIQEGSSWSLRYIWKTTREVTWTLGVPVVIFGGIYGGIATPTEAAMIASVYVVVVSLFIYKELKWSDLVEVIHSSAALSAKIFVIVAASAVFSWVLSAEQVPMKLIQGIQDANLSAAMVLMLVNVVLLIAGMFIDPTSAVLILVPLLWPMAQHVGVDVIHFGIIVTVNLAIGMFSPPFGLNIFVSSSIFQVSSTRIVKGLGPFAVAYLLALVIITYFPALSLVVPNMISGQ